MKKLLKRTLAILVSLMMLAVIVSAFTSCGCDNDGAFKLVIDETGAGTVYYSFCVPGARDGNEAGGGGGENAAYYKIAAGNDAATNTRAGVIAAYVDTIFAGKGWTKDSDSAHLAENNASNGGTPLDYHIAFTSVADLNAKLTALFGVATVTGVSLDPVTLTNAGQNHSVGITLKAMQAPIWAVGQKLIDDGYITGGKVNNQDPQNTTGIFSLYKYSVQLKQSTNGANQQTATATRKDGDGDKQNSDAAGSWEAILPTGSLNTTTNVVSASILIAGGSFAAERSALSAKISEAQAITGDAYSTVSFTALTNAITAGQTEFAKTDASTSAAALTAATTAISTAITNLEFKNIFRGKASVYDPAIPATGAGADTQSNPGLALDGVINSNSRWESNRGTAPFWMGVNLGSPREIGSIRIYWESCFATSFHLQSSTDGETWTTIDILGKGTAALAATSGKNNGSVLITDYAEYAFTNPVTAQYFRMYATTKANAWSCSMWEFEGFAPDPAIFKAALQAAINAASAVVTGRDLYRTDLIGGLEAAITAATAVYNNASATTTQIQAAIASLEAETAKLKAGDLAFNKNVTYYNAVTDSTSAASTGPTDHSSATDLGCNDFANTDKAKGFNYILDLGSVQQFDTIYAYYGNAPDNYTIQVSEDGTAYTTIGTYTFDDLKGKRDSWGEGYCWYKFSTQKARYIKIDVTLRYQASYVKIKDLEVYNELARINVVGAQKRVNAANAANSDMRFITEVAADNFLKTRTGSPVYITEMGTYLARVDWLAGRNIKDLVADTVNVKNVGCVYLFDSTLSTLGTYRYATTIVGITPAIASREYAACSYVKLSDGTVYYSNQIARCVNDLSA